MGGRRQQTVLDAAILNQILEAAPQRNILVVGDLILDHYVWGQVERISPEAPVPVVEVERESWMPGGAANVARNLRALGVRTSVVGIVGRDANGKRLQHLLEEEGADCSGLLRVSDRPTSIKTRVLAARQQIVRLDREKRSPLSSRGQAQLVQRIESQVDWLDAVIIGDYGKGVVTQYLLDRIQEMCRPRAIWVSLDPKPSNPLDLRGLSLITPNRKEAFALAGRPDGRSGAKPLEDHALLEAARTLRERYQPALLLITLGDQGMLLCRRNEAPFHIPTAAREVFDVSGAGDTVIAAFTLAIVAGASPEQAAWFSNLAAGVVVGKVGTAVATPEELQDSLAWFQQHLAE